MQCLEVDSILTLRVRWYSDILPTAAITEHEQNSTKECWKLHVDTVDCLSTKTNQFHSACGVAIFIAWYHDGLYVYLWLWGFNIAFLSIKPNSQKLRLKIYNQEGSSCDGVCYLAHGQYMLMIPSQPEGAIHGRICLLIHGWNASIKTIANSTNTYSKNAQALLVRNVCIYSVPKIEVYHSLSNSMCFVLPNHSIWYVDDNWSAQSARCCIKLINM